MRERINNIKEKIRNRNNPWAKLEQDLEKKRPLFFDRENRRDKLAKAGKVIGSLAVGTGALIGIAELSSAEVDSHAKEMNAKFEPVLKPAAESIADLALDKVAGSQGEGWDKSQGEGYVIPDDDPGKFYVHFEGKSDGAVYELDVVMGKDAEGKPDASKVSFAEIDLESEDGLVSSSDTIRETYNDNDYWGAASGTAHAGAPELGTGYTTYGSLNDSPDVVEKDVKTARTISHDVEREVENIRAGIYPFK
jgi:hypothetical protein